METVDELLSLHGGISQQDVSLRLPQQVEDSLNCYHTIESGTRRRNPTVAVNTSVGINSECWTYEYDRGLSDVDNEKYSIIYDYDGFRAIDLNSGESVPVIDNSDDYMLPFTSKTGYAAVTIKDTTFIVNRNKTCVMQTSDFNQTITEDLYITKSSLNISKDAPEGEEGIFVAFDAPTAVYLKVNVEYTYGGETYEYSTNKNIASTDLTIEQEGDSYKVRNVNNYLQATIDEAISTVLVPSVGSFKYYSDSALTSETLLQSNELIGSVSYQVTTTLLGTASGAVTTFPIIVKSSELTVYNSFSDEDLHFKTAYLWIKRSDPIDGYVYNVTVKVGDTSTTITSSEMLSTTEVSQDISTQLNEVVGITAEYDGNIVKISGDITNIYTSDNYGNLAIGYLWKTISTEADLPSSMPYDGALIEVGGQNNYDKSYWLVSEEGKWTESLKYSTPYVIDNSTMPHKLTRQYNSTDGSVYFQVEPMEWNDREVGDNDNSEQPSFIGTSISDIFFTSNRLGFLTPNSVAMSEVGKYYNFWKTTQVAILASDRIDVDIESKSALKLHYVEFLQENMLIFGERKQYIVQQDGVLSSATISVEPLSSYDINVKVRPYAIDNKLFFLAKNGDYNAMYTYEYEDENAVSSAKCVSTHIPQLLYGDIDEITGSSVNNTIFLKSRTYSDTVYVYKYLDLDNRNVQSAWSIWKFNGSIYSIFSTQNRLYMLMTRIDTQSDDTDWILFEGTWNDEGFWYDDSTWRDDELNYTDNIEYLDIIPQDVSDTFLDNGLVKYTSSIKLSEYLPQVGEGKRISDKINLKTIYVKASDDSIFELDIYHKSRDESRTISQEYVLGRKPYIMGKAKDTEISISSTGGDGFEINGVAIEARINNRSKSI